MEKEQLAKWLLQHDENVIRLAVMYATNYLQFGVDVTEKWCTAVQQQYALKNAEKHGYIKGQNSVEIVRCKDCKHYDKDENCELGTCLENGVCITPNWFCADGEPRTQQSK